MPRAEVVQAQHRTAEGAVLKLFPAEQVFVFVQVVRRESQPERIVIGGLHRLQRIVHGREHHARTAQMVFLEVVVGV